MASAAHCQLQRFVNLKLQILCQGQPFVNLLAQISWQAQHFVNFEMPIWWQAQNCEPRDADFAAGATLCKGYGTCESHGFAPLLFVQCGSHVCSCVFAVIYVCSHVFARVLSHVCSRDICALIRVLSCVSSHVSALIDVLSLMHVRFMRALICVL